MDNSILSQDDVIPTSKPDMKENTDCVPQELSMESLMKRANEIQDDDPRLWDEDPFDDVVMCEDGYRIRGGYLHEGETWDVQTRLVSANRTEQQTKEADQRQAAAVDQAEIEFFAEVYGISNKVAAMLVQTLQEKPSQDDSASLGTHVELLLATALAAEPSAQNVANPADLTSVPPSETTTLVSQRITQTHNQLFQSILNRDNSAFLRILQSAVEEFGTRFQIDAVHPAFGRSALMLVAEMGLLEQTKLLLAAGADPCFSYHINEERNGKSCDVIYDSIACASRVGHETLAMLLLEAALKHSTDSKSLSKRHHLESMERALETATVERKLASNPEPEPLHVDGDQSETDLRAEREKTAAEVREREVQADRTAAERFALLDKERECLSSSTLLQHDEQDTQDALDDQREGETFFEGSSAPSDSAQPTSATTSSKPAGRPMLLDHRGLAQKVYRNAHSRDLQGFTLAMNAVYRGQLRLARALVLAGTPVDAEGKHGETLASLLQELHGLTLSQFIRDTQDLVAAE